MTDVKAYIVVCPRFFRCNGELVERFAKAAHLNNTQVILPHDTFEQLRRSAKSRCMETQLNSGYKELDRLKFLLTESKELSCGQRAVRLQLPHEELLDHKLLKPFHQSDEFHAYGFLMYAKKTYKKKLFCLSNDFYLEFPFEEINVAVCCNPYHVYDMVNDKHRDTRLPYPWHEGTLYERARLTFNHLVDAHLFGCVYIEDNLWPESPEVLKKTFRKHRSKLLIETPVLDKFLETAKKTWQTPGVYADVIEALSFGDENYQELVDELRVPHPFGTHEFSPLEEKYSCESYKYRTRDFERLKTIETVEQLIRFGNEEASRHDNPVITSTRKPIHSKDEARSSKHSISEIFLSNNRSTKKNCIQCALDSDPPTSKLPWPLTSGINEPVPLRYQLRSKVPELTDSCSSGESSPDVPRDESNSDESLEHLDTDSRKLAKSGEPKGIEIPTVHFCRELVSSQ